MSKDYFNGKTANDRKIIHLFVTNDCTHHCKYCCNKEYSIDDIPVASINDLKNAEMICLTGGEPFLIPSICDFADKIKQQFSNIKTVYVYTCGDSLYKWLCENKQLHGIDGVNIAPKNKYDLECVNAILQNEEYRNQIISLWSSRIYLFPNVRNLFQHRELNEYDSIEILNRSWQEDFEPASGIFRRIPILF